MPRSLHRALPHWGILTKGGSEMLSTQDLGGVVITVNDLKAMQANDYILHACDGKLKKVPVQKIMMPLDPKGHYQILDFVLAPDGTIYAAQTTILSKSNDGGKTWEHFQRDPDHMRLLQVTEEGRFLNITQPPPTIWASNDAGITWEQLSRIDVSPLTEVVVGSSMTRLKDGTLMVPVMDIARWGGEWAGSPGRILTLFVFRSKDGGRTFPYRSVLCDWGGETNIAALPSGRLLAAVRRQRPRLPEDPPELYKRTGASEGGHVFKHLFLVDSEDGGITWTNLRQLTTVFGQCHGAAVGLSGKRVVVAHDHRYPREMGSGRAMISYDEGQTWADEAYYLSHGTGASFPRHITLDGEEILTFMGTYSGEVGKGWDYLTGRSHFMIIRWKPVAE